jgi:HD-GYP domain-containing protein (c-di-GMP phosphodiesterase class II)
MKENTMNVNGFFLLIWALVMTVMVGILFILIVRVTRKNQNVQLGFLKFYSEHYKPTLSMEKNLDILLLKMQELVQAPTYCFYIYNPANQKFTLKAVRQQTAETDIAPSYSGLLPYEKETYEPPLSLPRDAYPEGTCMITEGEVPILVIPIKGGKGLIRIGPISKLPAKTLKMLDEISQLVEIPLNHLIEEEDQRRNYQVLETSAKSVKYINQLWIHEVEYVKLLIQTNLKSLEPSACVVIEANASFHRVAFSIGLSQQWQSQRIYDSPDWLAKLRTIVGNQSFSIYEGSSRQNIQLQQLLRLNVDGYMSCAQFQLARKQYILLFSYPHRSKEVEQTRSQALKMLLSQIESFVEMKHRSRQEPGVSIDFLKGIADLMDQMSPFTTGASKLMANYSMAIAKSMGLSEYQIQGIGLAAYLSNIGIIGLSGGLLQKEGIYSDKEYEQMKLHAEVGADIIENLLALEEVALYVRHHHERIDGNGYPARLVGESIPVGARIIAVVQTFLAKINGRTYRDPLPFDAALALIRDAAGSQLDSKVVNHFLTWYESRRNSSRDSSQALGNCWELCCTPASICSQCPAYGNTTKNCWEQERNNCLAHGKMCQTCFVYTEALSRSRGKEVVS